jgi:hypothetical protein
VSIIRVGLAETKNFDTGYEAIFGKKTAVEPKGQKATARAAAPKKKKKAARKKPAPGKK